MKSGVLHCRCSKCFSLPSKRRLRKRPRLVTLLSLPEDVLLHILKCLPAEDILSVRAVHSHFKSLVDTHTSVWACACFQDAWPSPENLRLFERAAECGNFEAAVKLGIAYLYNEGLSFSDEGRAEVNGLKASHFFSLTERLNASSNPFVWLFIRPPWSVSGSCCKAVVYESLKEECQSQTVQKGSVLYCLAKVLSLFEDEEKKVAAQTMFEESSKQGCLTSSYLLWKRHRKTAMGDPGRYLQSLRKLRDYAAKGCWEAQLSLAKACGNGNQLGLEPRACNELVAQVFQASHPVNKASIFTVQKGMNDTMRYILIDWLVEVATMKDFSSLCLHMTVGCVDRYLKLRSVPRARLQLVGIACMVICTRFISKEILTIREAVWLTDNTYKYEDLVRMMGEIISALDGKIRTPTLVDYKDVLSNIAPLERKTLHLCSYICELSLLYTDLSLYSPAQLATAALLLAKILHRQTHPWSSHLAECTGFTLEELTPCVLNVHKKCFHDDTPKDYRQVSLTAVKQRFEDDCYDEISKEKVMDHSQLCALLGVKQEEEPEPSPPLTSAVEVQAFLCSPAGNKTKRRRADSINDDRGSFVTTPTAELSSQEDTLLGNFLDWSLDSSCTGYEGDGESEGEKEGDVTGPSGILDITVVHVDPDQHCCEDSSDEDENNLEQDLQGVLPPEHCIASNGALKPFLTFNTPKQPLNQASSGYSSVNSSSPNSSLESSCTTPTTATSATLSQWVSGKVWPLLTQYLKPHSHPVPLSLAEDNGHRRPVKRKNIAGHSDEDTKIGVLSL